MVSKCIGAELAKGNLINVNHNQDARSNHWTLFFLKLMSFKRINKKTIEISKSLVWFIVNE
jgi:hypothetical protein